MWGGQQARSAVTGDACTRGLWAGGDVKNRRRPPPTQSKTTPAPRTQHVEDDVALGAPLVKVPHDFGQLRGLKVGGPGPGVEVGQPKVDGVGAVLHRRRELRPAAGGRQHLGAPRGQHQGGGPGRGVGGRGGGGGGGNRGRLRAAGRLRRQRVKLGVLALRGAVLLAKPPVLRCLAWRGSRGAAALPPPPLAWTASCTTVALPALRLPLSTVMWAPCLLLSRPPASA